MKKNLNEINKFRVVNASLPDRKKCVCEIYYDHCQWEEISQEDEEIMIQFYSHPSKDFWEFSLDLALETLSKAKNRFMGVV